MTIELETTLSRNSEVLHAPVGTGETLMMSNATGRYYGVNAVGRRIWELLETPTAVGQICTQLCAEFEVEQKVCEAAVLQFAEELVDNKIVHAD